ncbi:SH3 domain-containing protein [Jimgerdemannia flammicorona]|uniref:SH3 domain-containing protein n=1 Tax=Jimgerdemannia flammicorona TaxID=994334 RepID=A0A433QU32_9FUNG|nr:SH3 domain-containing protein [Jimgerdemannia flammicorona]
MGGIIISAAEVPQPFHSASIVLTNFSIRSTDYLVKAHSDYEATQDDELTLKAGDIVKVTNKDDPDWWQGEMIGRSGNGLFPSNVGPFDVS